MPRGIVRIDAMQQRLPEHGRIRIGEKGGKGQPQKIEVFRFTSVDKNAIEQIAELYGGTVKVWEQQWEVKTEAKEIPIVLPPDPLGGTPVYELWSKGGCQRRCDGEVCQVPTQTADGAEMVGVPCICSKDEALACKPKTRLNVILPEVTFGGSWRLESGGWNVAQEMPGMIGLIYEMQSRGFQRAILALEPRKSVFAGQTRKFVVPVVRPSVSVNVMIEGGGSVKALAPAPTQTFEAPALEPERAAAVTVVVDGWDRDDEVIEAEIVEGDDTPEVPSHDETLNKKRKALHASIKDALLADAERHALVRRITKGDHESSNDLSVDELDRLIKIVKGIGKGEFTYNGEDEQGWALVGRTQ